MRGKETAAKFLVVGSDAAINFFNLFF